MKIKWWVTREGYLDNENYGGIVEIPDEEFKEADIDPKDSESWDRDLIIEENVNDAFNQYISYAWEIVEE